MKCFNTDNVLRTVKSLKHEKYRKNFLFLAFTVFILGFLWSVFDKPDTLLTLSWTPVLVIFALLAPLHIFLLIAEFYFSAKILRVSVSVRDAQEITILGIAANYLPIPGNVMVKMTHLKSLGVPLKDSGILNIALYAIWLSCSLLIAALGLIILSAAKIWIFIFLLTGVLFLFGTLYILYTRFHSLLLLLLLTSFKFFTVFITSLRFYLCFIAIGIYHDFSSTLVLTSSQPLGAGLIIFPAGLGISEIFAALLARLISIGIKEAYLAAFLNRIFGIASLLIISSITIFGKSWKRN